MKFSKTGIIFSSIYLGIFLLSGIYTICILIFKTANSEFSGIFSVFITLPWSIIFVKIYNVAGYIKWYESFAGNPAAYGFFALLGLIPAALLNASILYFIGRMFGGSGRKKDYVSEPSQNSQTLDR